MKTSQAELHGYYVILSRCPYWDLGQWKSAFDCYRQDGADTVILWISGGFRSRAYPETWQHNRDHKNIQEDFVTDLIDHAHTLGIQVLLGLSPFAYDGVNQYPKTHPETHARQADGSPALPGGMHCLGPSLCPAVPDSQRFMFDYVREMTEDFYPNADGLFIESVDYERCLCEQCRTHYYDYEYRLVEDVSRFFWQSRPGAEIVVYPHYFIDAPLTAPNVKGRGAGRPFDPRWTLFFTPHSAVPEADEHRALIAQARRAIFWDLSPVWGNPAQIQAAARRARDSGLSYLPSLEAYCYVAAHVEFDHEDFIVGRQLKPMGLEWIDRDRHPYFDPLVRLNRLAYREYSRNPDLDEAAFRRIVGRALFGADDAPAVQDLFFLVDAVLADRQDSFFFASPLVLPERLLTKAQGEGWPEERLAPYRTRLREMRRLAERDTDASNPVEQQMQQIAAYIAQNWDGQEVSNVRRGNGE